MPILVDCRCGAGLRVGDEHAGKKLRCPYCQATVRVADSRGEDLSFNAPAPSDAVELIEARSAPRKPARQRDQERPSTFRQISGVIVILLGIAIGLLCLGTAIKGRPAAIKGLFVTFLMIGAGIKRIRGEQQ